MNLIMIWNSVDILAYKFSQNVHINRDIGVTNYLNHLYENSDNIQDPVNSSQSWNFENSLKIMQFHSHSYSYTRRKIV